MSCDEANPFIEAAAVGEAVPDTVALHLNECRQCRARLTLAKQIDLALKRRPVPAPSPAFTASVMRRLRDERWHAERVVDLGFNVAVSLGLLIIAIGLAGLAWRLGVLHINEAAWKLLADGAALVARRAATDSRLVMIGMLLVTTAIGLWWWAEEDTFA